MSIILLSRQNVNQVPDLVSTALTLIVMIAAMFIVNVCLTIACLVPIILGFFFLAKLMGNMDKLGVKERADAAEEINASSVEYVRVMLFWKRRQSRIRTQPLNL